MMKEVNDMVFFVKVGQIQHLEALQNGKIYMNNLKYYVDLEKNSGKQGVGDILEASQINIKKHKIFIKIDDGEEKEIPIGLAPGIVYDTEALYHPVFCMMIKIVDLHQQNKKEKVGSFQLKEEELVDFMESNKNMGTLIVTDVAEFLKRVEEAVAKIGVQGKYGKIIYRDKRIPRVVDRGILLDDTFTKDVRFENQSEFRVELFMHIKEPMILDIGDIGDISYIAKESKITDELTIVIRVED